MYLYVRSVLISLFLVSNFEYLLCVSPKKHAKSKARTQSIKSEDFSHDAECESGEEKMDDCNRCWCDGDVWACTRMACYTEDEYATSDCENGEHLMVDNGVDKPCGGCKCKRGSWLCNRKGCFNEDPPTDDCEPTEFRVLGCNYCYCENGFWACSYAECNKDGVNKEDDNKKRNDTDNNDSASN